MLLSKNGIKTVNDTHRYFEYAEALREGFYFDPHNFWYIGYVIFLVGFQLFSTSMIPIVLAQYLLSLMAVFSLYKTAHNIHRDPNAGLFTALSFIVFFELSSWNSYLLTESLYISCICYCLLLYTEIIINGRHNFQIYAATFVLTVFTSLLKPTGVSLIGALVICSIYFIIIKKKRFISIPVAGVVTLAFLLIVNKMLTTFLVIENYRLGEIIYAITTLPEKPGFEYLKINPPKDLVLPSHANPPIVRIIQFAVSHPIYWTKLCIAKTFFLLAHIRPYWSLPHNIFSLFFLLPTYYMFLKTIISESHKKLISIFAVSFLSIQILSVALTSEDWDGRFLMPMLPVFFIFSGHGFSHVVAFISKRTREPGR